MSELALTSYIMVWPAIAAIFLIVVCGAFAYDVHKAKQDGESVV